MNHASCLTGGSNRSAFSVAAMLLVSLSAFALSVPATAGLIEINLTALVQSNGGPMQDASARFVLDSSVSAPVGQYANPGAIVEASFVSGEFSGNGGSDSIFNSLFATTLPDGRDGIQLIAEGASGIFGIELFGDGLFLTSNLFDSLTSDLTLDDFDPYDPNQVLTTAFIFFAGSEVYQGGLTSFSISPFQVNEPAAFWLMLLGSGLFVFLRSRQRRAF